MKELRAIVLSQSSPDFEKQMGPFVLIQHPPDPEVQKMALELGAGVTQASGPITLAQEILSLLFEFDDLVVAALPPVRPGDELTVGRLPDCDLVIDNPSVSKRHAVLRWAEAVDRTQRASACSGVNPALCRRPPARQHHLVIAEWRRDAAAIASARNWRPCRDQIALEPVPKLPPS
jgi:hypothetical protein